MTQTLPCIKCALLLIISVKKDNLPRYDDEELRQWFIYMLDDHRLVAAEDLAELDKMADLLPGKMLEKWIALQRDHYTAFGLLTFGNFVVLLCDVLLWAIKYSISSFDSIHYLWLFPREYCQASIRLYNPLIHIHSYFLFNFLLFRRVFINRIQ